MRLYLDTSVLGATFDPEPEMHVVATRRLFDSIGTSRHLGFISDVVLEEIGKAPEALRSNLLEIVSSLSLEVLLEDDRTRSLVGEYGRERFVRPAASADLRHIAVATVHGLDALVSWNFHDIVNVRSRRGIHAVNLRLGYPLLDIVSPLEVVEHG